MNLTRTKNGNYGKQIGIGSDYESHGVFATREAADAALAELLPRLIAHERNRDWHVRECEAGAKLVERLGVVLGATCYMIGVAKRKKQVMVHATAAECIAAGRTPGAMNV